jgi:hypothetical protein
MSEAGEAEAGVDDVEVMAESENGQKAEGHEIMH